MYRLVGKREENGRTILVIEKSSLFGLFKSTIECIDSDQTYFSQGFFGEKDFETVWYHYPSMERIGPLEKLQKFCNKQN